MGGEHHHGRSIEVWYLLLYEKVALPPLGPAEVAMVKERPGVVGLHHKTTKKVYRFVFFS